MNIDEIISTKEQLEQQLKIALSTMEKKDTVNAIRRAMRMNQDKCPHFSEKYNFVWTDDTCPYCGKLIVLGVEYR